MGDGKSIDYRWDSEIRGFGVRVYASGKKSFVLLYRHEGKQRLYTIDQYGKITLEQARDLARKRLGEVADNQDIVAERQKAKQKHEYTVKKAFTLFMNKYAKIHNRNWHEPERIFKHDVLPKLGSKPIDEVTKADIIKIIDAIMDRHKRTQATRTFAAVRKFFNWCVERDMIQHSPVTGLKPPAPPKARDRVLSDHELRQVWIAAEEVGYPFGPIVQCLILTGQRKTEVTEIMRDHIDIKQKLWTIPKEANKSGREHYVHLAPLTLSILQAQPKLGDYVFTSSGAKPYENFTRGYDALIFAINKKRAEMGMRGMQKWTLHDLRRSTASGMAALKVSPYVIEKILNHKSGIISGVAAVYNRYNYADEAKNALEAWAEHIQEILEEEPQSVSVLRVPESIKAKKAK